MDTKNLLKFPLQILNLITVQQPLSDDRRGKFLKFWYRLVMFEVTFAVSTYIYQMISNLKNVELLIEAIYLVTSGLFAWMKFMTIVCRKESFDKLIDNLRNMIRKGWNMNKTKNPKYL
jgi:hypothetical protein